jgi:hypothetical protein
MLSERCQISEQFHRASANVIKILGSLASLSPPSHLPRLRPVISPRRNDPATSPRPDPLTVALDGFLGEHRRCGEITEEVGATQHHRGVFWVQGAVGAGDS